MQLKIFVEIINWFLERVLSNKYPFPTVDAVIKYYKNGKFEGIVLVDRKFPPLGWAFPGGFVEHNETLEKAVAREVMEETGLHITGLEQFHTYSEPKRDPRIHTISTVFLCKAEGKIQSGSDAKNVKVFPLEQIPPLCFDHQKILEDLKKNGKLKG
ncbi:MAG: NUDIX hydrolase [Candidatus Diapherotrites archaeon]|nr:NUDIX hydrolase [Candidatus Diapherotrites archaeon]